jgi:hypothetical protein
LAQARKVGVILVTELTSWAVRSLTCFKFRFVSSPLLVPTFTMQRALCDNLNMDFREMAEESKPSQSLIPRGTT